jgi:Chalcone isomerase-like
VRHADHGVATWAAVLLVSTSVAANAADVAGIRLDERTKVGASELVLNGAGLRRWLFFKVYVAGLYLTERRDLPAAVFAIEGPKRASITLMRSLPASDLVDALNDGILDNSSPAEQQLLKGRVDALSANLLALRQGNKGDVITVDWLPDRGTVVILNGVVQGSPIPGYDLYRALLKVWLGERPTNAGLKKALLGQKH